jgi:hypothetical protein
MKRFLCNGKKGYCDRGNDNKIDCSACEFASGTGGEVVDCPDTVFEKIKAMSIDEMVDFIIKSTDHCDLCSRKGCPTCVDVEGGCKKYIKEYLESEVDT